MKHINLLSAIILLSVSLFAQSRQTAPTYAAKPHQQHTMMLLGKMDIGRGMISSNANDIIYAFIEGECRGTAHPMSEHDGLIFLSIAENSELAKTISFKAWLDDRQELLPLNEIISFEPLAAIGDLGNPFILTLGEMVGTDELTEGIWIGEAYPNPTRNETYISITAPFSSQMIIEVFNMFGQKIFEQHQAINTKTYQYKLPTKWSKGVYNYNIKLSTLGSSQIKNGKIIVQ